MKLSQSILFQLVFFFLFLFITHFLHNLAVIDVDKIIEEDEIPQNAIFEDISKESSPLPSISQENSTRSRSNTSPPVYNSSITTDEFVEFLLSMGWVVRRSDHPGFGGESQEQRETHLESSQSEAKNQEIESMDSEYAIYYAQFDVEVLFRLN